MMVSRSSFSFALKLASKATVVLTCLVAFCTDARSEGETADPHLITLSVRTIQASDRRAVEQPQVSSVRPIRLEGNIRDLESKLSQLPFDSFQLLSTKEETIPLKIRDSLQLPNGHSLTFRPMYIDTKKVGLWLHWRDQDGGEILNTRVHFDATDSVLTGTDCAQDKGLILAIKALAGR
jgi:hypothetical protein